MLIHFEMLEYLSLKIIRFTPSHKCGHKVRTKRCAMTPIKELASRKGSIPISFKRVTAPIAVLVCSVDSTK